MAHWSEFDPAVQSAYARLTEQDYCLLEPSDAEVASYKQQALWELAKRLRFEKIACSLLFDRISQDERADKQEAEIQRLTKKVCSAIMITLAINLSTGEERTYVGLSPEQTAMAAYAQQHGDWNTWDYETKYKHLVKKTGLLKCGCGDWSVCVMTESEMLSKHDAERKDPGSQQV